MNKFDRFLIFKYSKVNNLVYVIILLVGTVFVGLAIAGGVSSWIAVGILWVDIALSEIYEWRLSKNKLPHKPMYKYWKDLIRRAKAKING